MKIAASGRCRRHSAWSVIATVLAAGAGLTLAACGPGVATPMPEPPTLDLRRIGPPEGAVPETTAAGGGRHIFGLSGAAPAGALVRVTNLDRMDLPSASNALPDGSFDLTVAVTDGEELRFDWSRGAERGAPQDARFVKDPVWGHVEPSARFACLKLTPGFELDFAGQTARVLTLRNECVAPVTLGMPRLRLGLTDFQLQTLLPVSVPSGQSQSLDLSFSRAQPTAREETLFLDLTLATETLRYPITLLAPAAP